MRIATFTEGEKMRKQSDILWSIWNQELKQEDFSVLDENSESPFKKVLKNTVSNKIPLFKSYLFLEEKRK